MKRNFLAVVAAALALVGAPAWSHATVSARFGPISAGNDSSGWSFDYFRIDNMVPLGGSIALTYDYVVNVHIDGLSAARTWGGCIPTNGSWCGPKPTGEEQVEVDFFFVEARDGSADLAWGIKGGPPSSELFTAPGDYSLSGTFTVTATRGASDDPWSSDDNISLVVGTFDDSSPLSPVPEPAELTLLLAGLPLLKRASNRKC